MSKLTYEQLQDTVYHELGRLLDYKMPIDMFKNTVGLMPRMLETLLAQYFLTYEHHPSLDVVVAEVTRQYQHLTKTGVVDVVPEP